VHELRCETEWWEPFWYHIRLTSSPASESRSRISCTSYTFPAGFYPAFPNMLRHTRLTHNYPAINISPPNCTKDWAISLNGWDARTRRLGVVSGCAP